MTSAALLTLRVPAFDAAIRKAVDPGLASRPVAVVTSFKPLGRVLAACPVAESCGIGMDMPYPAARNCCPDAVFFVPDRRLSERALRALLEQALAFSPQVEPGGEEAFLARVPVAWIDGVSAKTRSRPLEMNIRSAGQLRQFAREDIVRQFGAADGEALWNVVHPHPWNIAVGRATADITDEAVRVEAALTEATVNGEKVRLVARALAEQVAATLRTRNSGAARLRLTLLHVDGAMKSAVAATGGFVRDETMLAALASTLLERVFRRRVRVGRLWLAAEKLSAPERQGVLFSPAAIHDKESRTVDAAKTATLLNTLDRIRRRYGDDGIRPAAMVAPTAGKFAMRLGKHRVS
ncbi:MAG: hypothetical protein LBT97_13265 [Planctomycetota bacterium]|jgi:nucleotidyltransferase/DNA polymerase involved in DNA repair|nr:hypothetical protein [Planctomycetota bacterium]